MRRFPWGVLRQPIDIALPVVGLPLTAVVKAHVSGSLLMTHKGSK
ncbi:MAG: hypothetical protein PHV34_23980 [Verrucomicrobiae bacterium]|nr:hypothetical protein [Verrucomicrobiae bacterium]